jgi:hypothetical protein
MFYAFSSLTTASRNPSEFWLKMVKFDPYWISILPMYKKRQNLSNYE